MGAKPRITPRSTTFREMRKEEEKKRLRKEALEKKRLQKEAIKRRWMQDPKPAESPRPAKSDPIKPKHKKKHKRRAAHRMHEREAWERSKLARQRLLTATPVNKWRTPVQRTRDAAKAMGRRTRARQAKSEAKSAAEKASGKKRSENPYTVDEKFVDPLEQTNQSLF